MTPRPASLVQGHLVLRYSMSNETHTDTAVGYKCKKTVEIVFEY